MADNAGLTESLEDYLETILLLTREHTVARSRDIAARLNVQRSSVTGALHALADRKLIYYEPYGYVTLTEDGTKEAERVRRRHEILRDFMIKVLSVDAEEADTTACRMEHAVSKNVVDRLVAFAEFVESCPDAGAEWVRGFGYRCAKGHDRKNAVCKRCKRGVSVPAGR
jgi:DtxR family transcriptional regulator, Mn-dependent transcriptional regulator